MVKKIIPPSLPIAFVSSTAEDLRPHRLQTTEAINQEGFTPRKMEYWTAKDVRPPLDECMVQITGEGTDHLPPANVLVVIVAHRYGWVPEDQDGDEQQSITWLECLKAEKQGLEILAFIHDDPESWPDRFKENYRVVEAMQEKQSPDELARIYADVQHKEQKLQEFKDWLMPQRICRTFKNENELFNDVRSALKDWMQRHPEWQPSTKLANDDPTEYLKQLDSEFSHIDIRGLQVSEGQANRLSIDDFYIPLTMTGRVKELPDDVDGKDAASAMRAADRSHVALDEALKHRLLAVIGDPGAGKTTFLKRIAFLLCQTLLGRNPDAINRLGLVDALMPLYLRVGDLCQHIARRQGNHEGPESASSPDWMIDFLSAKSDELGWGLSPQFFDSRLENGTAILLVDGLDEAPNDAARKQVSEIIRQAATKRFQKSRVVVTSRPAAYEGEVVLLDFTQAKIEHLEDDAIERFLRQWSEMLFSGSPRQAESHHGELLHALHTRPEIRRIARNPVMLTALAVVHWNERRVPEQRADLYDSIIKWLARSRDQKRDPEKRRASPETCVSLLQDVALFMHDHPDGRQTQMPRRIIAEAIADHWADEPEERQRIAKAEQFLQEEELDSGIIVGRGSDVRFWHLTFQEFLAARALAARTDEYQSENLFRKPEKLFQSEWREVVLLLAGVLRLSGIQKVDRMFSEILNNYLSSPSADLPLVPAAHYAGLLGCIVNDLSPVKYKPKDPRYQELFDGVMGIFDAKKSQDISIKVRIEAADALARAGDPRFTSRLSEDNNWITIPAASYLMKSTNNQNQIGDFKIGRYPLTVGEFAKFVGDELESADNGYNIRRWWKHGGFGEYGTSPDEWDDQLQHPSRPVVRVNWFEACAYAEWLSSYLPADQFCRLLTEAEWELAAGGVEGREYPWGINEPDESLANFGPDFKPNVGHPTPVGLYPLGYTPDGIQDLAGNVWEWCLDWYHENPAAGSDPVALEAAAYRVLRGGSWYYSAVSCRVADRGGNAPGLRDYYVGFRLALVQSPLSSSQQGAEPDT